MIIHTITQQTKHKILNFSYYLFFAWAARIHFLQTHTYTRPLNCFWFLSLQFVVFGMGNVSCSFIWFGGLDEKISIQLAQ